jgi:glycosyltransferase involved in cell wall biosynthesis
LSERLNGKRINLLFITNKKMKISIVVPCYNMENFIEESLLSIINQNYLESYYSDGKSTDRTLEIISKYDKYIL